MNARASIIVRVSVLACASVGVPACGAATKSSASTATAVQDAGGGAAPAEPVPERVQPWPQAKQGAAWTVVEWGMTADAASQALAQAGLALKARSGPAIDVVSSIDGWKASITFDDKTGQIRSIVVHGDPATIAQAHAERAQLEERFGAPVETHVHWSKQCANDRAIEIEGPKPAWRVTQSLTRQGDAKTAVDWPSLAGLSWGLPFAAIAPAMKKSGFSPEKLPPPPRSKKPAAKAPKSEKLLVVGFVKNDEHVRLGVLEKAGLQSVAASRDAVDRKDAERRANDVLGALGSCLSEAESESSIFRDGTAEVRLTITGFQGQRVVVETYRDPQSPEK